MAVSVVAIEPIQYFGEFTASRAKPREQQLAFLGVVDPLRELVNVEQHRPQGPHDSDRGFKQCWNPMPRHLIHVKATAASSAHAPVSLNNLERRS